ncbi:MAG: dihydrofolate reductase [Pseudomonadales bacterium]|nr:dihydrofolate reductase [Pseudomonadales bacterium]
MIHLQMEALSLIYARSINYCIGAGGRVPWELPDEYALFERTTRNHAIIMGRASWEDHRTTLPDRLNIVVTSRPAAAFSKGIRVARSLPEALSLARSSNLAPFVIGGTRLLAEAMPLTTRVFETIVDVEVEGDTYVDAFDFTGWHASVVDQRGIDANNRYAWTTRRYQKPMPKET